ncbi:short chain oxidoreductase [Mycena crocata]|nr:short chain oxidoreductase [Mycena crocata]
MTTEIAQKRVAIVTGANRGIGKAIALALAKDGLDLVLTDLAENPCTDTLGEASEMGARCEFMACDVREEEQVKELVSFALSSFHRLDVFVANAGILTLNSVIQTSHEQLQKMIDTNVHGTLHCIKHAGTAMTAQISSGKVKGSTMRIIVGGSLAGKKGGFMHAGYVSTKFAVRGLVQTAAMEFGPYGITVNSYAPGLIMTNMAINAADQFFALTEGMPGFGSETGPAAFAKLGAAQTALKRNGEPHEVASLVSYLASEGSSFITGQSISIDGGTNFD